MMKFEKKKGKGSRIGQASFLVKRENCSINKTGQNQTFTTGARQLVAKASSQIFNVAKYLVHTATCLTKEKVILAEPERKAGKSFPDATVAVVKAFYKGVEFSRMMPGKKDYVSDGKNIHMQKRLL